MIKVIAHFSAVKSFMYAAVVGTTICIILAIAAHPATLEYFGRAGYWRTHYGYWLLLVTLAWSGGIVCLLFVFALIRQLVLRNRIAVWVDGNQLIYLDRHYFSLSLSEIARSSIGPCDRFNSPGLVIVLRDGARKSIPLRLLRESGEQVLEQLPAAESAT